MGKKILFIITMLLAAGIIVHLLLPVFQPPEEPVGLIPLVKEEAPVKPIETEGLYVEGAQIALVDEENRVVWNLVIGGMVEEGEELIASVIEGEYFTPSGEAFQVYAVSGRVSKDLTILCLEEEVTLIGEDFNLQVKELRWETGSRDLLLGEEVLWEKEGIRVQAKRFKADPDLKQITVEGGSRWEFLAER